MQRGAMSSSPAGQPLAAAMSASPAGQSLAAALQGAASGRPASGSTYIVAGQALPRSAFGESGPANARPDRFGEKVPDDARAERGHGFQRGECRECSQHCPPFTVSPPERVYTTHTGHPMCCLCYQAYKTIQQLRRIRKNTSHHIHFMKQLEEMEMYARELTDSDDLLVHEVLPWDRGFNAHGVPISAHPWHADVLKNLMEDDPLPSKSRRDLQKGPVEKGPNIQQSASHKAVFEPDHMQPSTSQSSSQAAPSSSAWLEPQNDSHSLAPILEDRRM